MDVLITGGAGFLGASLAEALLAGGSRVTVFDNLSNPAAEAAARRLNARWDRTGRLTFVFRDVRDAAELERAVVGMDAVFHAAGNDGEETALLDPREDFSTRVSGTFNVLEAMRARAPLAHLILPSSASVYGVPPVINGCATIAANETQPLSPENPSASGSACAEKYALAYARAYGLRVTVLRLATVYGSDSRYAGGDGLVARLISAARQRFAIAPPSDPRWPIDLVHVDDVSEAALSLWASPDEANGQVFNVGGGARLAPSLFEIAEHLALLGGHLSLLPPIGSAHPAFVLDNSRLRGAVEWEPAVDWQEGISRLFAVTDPLSRRDDAADTDHFHSNDSWDGISHPLDSGAVVAWPRAEGLA